MSQGPKKKPTSTIEEMWLILPAAITLVAAIIWAFCGFMLLGVWQGEVTPFDYSSGEKALDPVFVGTVFVFIATTFYCVRYICCWYMKTEQILDKLKEIEARLTAQDDQLKKLDN